MVWENRRTKYFVPSGPMTFSISLKWNKSILKRESCTNGRCQPSTIWSRIRGIETGRMEQLLKWMHFLQFWFWWAFIRPIRMNSVGPLYWHSMCQGSEISCPESDFFLSLWICIAAITVKTNVIIRRETDSSKFVCCCLGQSKLGTRPTTLTGWLIEWLLYGTSVQVAI